MYEFTCSTFNFRIYEIRFLVKVRRENHLKFEIAKAQIVHIHTSSLGSSVMLTQTARQKSNRDMIRLFKFALPMGTHVHPGSKDVFIFFTFNPNSLSKVNLTKPRTLLNPELSNETWRCNHSNESSQWALCNGGVHVVSEQSSCFCNFFV